MGPIHDKFSASGKVRLDAECGHLVRGVSDHMNRDRPLSLQSISVKGSWPVSAMYLVQSHKNIRRRWTGDQRAEPRRIIYLPPFRRILHL